MLNTKPTRSEKYRQGLFVPKNKNKLIQANDYGGAYYRSNLEHKFMVWLDQNEKIIRWSSENIKIPYEKTEWDSRVNELVTTTHIYYPDYYYELNSNGKITKVVAEVKPLRETREPEMKYKNPTTNQLKNFEYELKTWNKNLSKWKYMIEWCQRKGFEFIIITEENLGK